MKLHINKIHDTHSVRSQLLRIFLLAGMFPLLVIGIFSIASVRKQMLARYESLEKADGLRVLILLKRHHNYRIFIFRYPA